MVPGEFPARGAVGAMAEPIRIGAVRYLNARPLIEGLEALAPRVTLELDYPSVLADRLAAGALDVALIPSAEYFRGRVRDGYEILPGLAIAARGAVRSVKLFSRVPLGSIERLALDDGSRTSQVLVQVWLDAVHGVRPARIERLPVGVSALESTADAVLVIGDRAMRVPHDPFVAVVDLGAAWVELTGLPFVFALWVTRPGLDLGGLPEILRECRAAGLARADDLAAEYGPKLGLSRAECSEYLTSVLSYDLGEAEQAGLRQFARMAGALGLVPGGADLAFYRSPADLAARR